MRLEQQLACIVLAMLFLVFGCAAVAESSNVVVLPDSLREIKEEAFMNNTSIDEVVLPANIKTIGKLAFAGSNVGEVFLPASLIYIEDDAFADCENFAPSAIPGTYAYDWCLRNHYPVQYKETPAEYFNYSIYDNRYVEIKGYTGQDRIVIIPQSIEGYEVGRIAAKAFYNNKTIDGILIPDTVTTIGANAFYGCDLMRFAKLGSSITTIGEAAFSRCAAIESIELPAALETINYNAFANCVKLEEVIFNDGLKTVGPYAFDGCERLLNAELPDSVQAIGSYAFHNCRSLETFHYPLNWKEVPRRNVANAVYGYIFENADKLTQITVPDGVTAIPSYAFTGSTALTDISLNNGIVEIGEAAFSRCIAIESIEMPAALETIKYNAFANCVNLEEATFNDGLKTIGPYAFDGCERLLRAELPDSVQAIGSYAFHNCRSLESFRYPLSWKEVPRRNVANAVYGYIFENTDKLTQISIPAGVTAIPNYAFKGTTALVDISFNDGLVLIGEDAFADCPEITAIEIPVTVETIGAKAFKSCVKLTDVKLSEGLKTIKGQAFMGCPFSELAFPEGLETIEAGAFENCANLVAAVLPDSVKTIGYYAFAGCVKLSSFHYPLSWSSCPESLVDARYRWSNGGQGHVFYGCEALLSIRITEGVKSTPTYAFANCDKLVDVTLPSTLKTIGKLTFNNCPSIEDMVFPDGLEEVGVGAFEGCVNLKRADLPDSVQRIGCFAFENCGRLEYFHYPVSWTDVIVSSGTDGKYSVYLSPWGNVFNGCEMLTHIDIPEGVLRIPDHAFRHAHFLVDVSVPTTLQEVGAMAFNDCERFEEIYLGYNVTRIGNKAFGDCPVLTLYTEYHAVAHLHAVNEGIHFYYLTPDHVSSPSGTLYRGDKFTICGYARASVDLNMVTATIWDGSGQNVLQTVTIDPQTTDYNLSGAVNRALHFESLALGSYRYTLDASTEITEEHWVDNSFTIVPPPLRMYLRDASLPEDIVNLTGGYSIGGTIISNYEITEVRAEIFNYRNNQVRSATAAPGSLSYDIGNLSGSLNIVSLPANDYHLRITATSNGESRVLAETAFTPYHLDHEIDSENEAAILRFVANAKNSLLFHDAYISDALSNLTFKDTLLMAAVSRKKWIYDTRTIVAGFFGPWIDTSDWPSDYMVSLYESELASVIAQLNMNEIDLPSLDKTRQYIINQVLALDSINRKIWEQSELDELKLPDKPETNEILKKFIEDSFEDLDKSIKRYQNILKGVNFSLSLAEDIATVSCNYIKGLYVITLIGDTIADSDNEEMKIAVDKLYARYKSVTLNVLISILDEGYDYAREKVIDEIFDLIKSNITVQEISGTATLYKLIDMAVDVTLKITGLQEKGTKHIDFLVQSDCYFVAIQSYRDAFFAIRDGDNSQQTLNKLLVSFDLAKDTCIRVHNTILDMEYLTTIYQNMDKQEQIMAYINEIGAITIIPEG